MEKNLKTYANLCSGCDKGLFFFLRRYERYFANRHKLFLSLELVVDDSLKLTNQVVLDLLLQLQQFPLCLWQRNTSIAEEVEYGAKVFATSVYQYPACGNILTDIY